MQLFRSRPQSFARLPAATALAAVATLLVVGCGDSSSPMQGDNTVTINDNSFMPSDLTVTTGTTVTWSWAGSNAHNVTWVSGSPSASATQSSGSYQRTFDTPGVYQYYCTIHGSPTSGMRGEITVQ